MHFRAFIFNDDVELIALLEDFFDLKSGDFYHRDAGKILGRGKEVVNNNGEYVFD